MCFGHSELPGAGQLGRLGKPESHDTNAEYIAPQSQTTIKSAKDVIGEETTVLNGVTSISNVS